MIVVVVVTVVSLQVVVAVNLPKPVPDLHIIHAFQADNVYGVGN